MIWGWESRDFGESIFRGQKAFGEMGTAETSFRYQLQDTNIISVRAQIQKFNNESDK